MAKTKIVLDADVIIHFSEGGLLAQLPMIFSEYDHIVLSKVYEELRREEKHCIDWLEKQLGNVSVVPFDPKGDMLREYARLVSSRGKGESACMSYCKFNNDVIGSSNLKDIRDYCTDNGITYLTTFDFLYYAIKRDKISIEEAQKFVGDVKDKGSKLPDEDIATYISSAIM